MSLEGWFENPGQKGKKRRLLVTIFFVVVGLHLLGGVGAGLFVVARYFLREPVQFEVKKDIRLPAKKREHKMNMAAFDGMVAKPSFTDRMASVRPAEIALPDLPKVTMDQVLAVEPSQMVADAIESFSGESGSGAGGSGGAGLGGLGEGVSFLGIQASGKRVALLFDVSKSVVNKAEKSGVPMRKIREEAIRCIEEMGVNSRFAIYQFVRNYKAFRPEFLPATRANKDAARGWIEREWSEGGQMPASGKGVVSRLPNGIEMVLEDVFQKEPDLVIIVSDGSFQRSVGKGEKAGGQEEVTGADLRGAVGRLQKRLPEAAQIYFVGFEMEEEDRRDLQALARAYRGNLREIGKE